MSKRICIFGDSITFGQGDPLNGGWVNLLNQFFQNSNYSVSVYNQGIPGDNTDDLLERLEAGCEKINPKIIIFSIGINDSGITDLPFLKSGDSERIKGTPIEKFKSNLEKLLIQAKKFSDKMIFTGLTKIDTSALPELWDTAKFDDGTIVTKYNCAIKEISKKNNLPFIDLIDLLENFDLADGVHPNSKGHEKIFLKVKEFLISEEVV